MLSAASASVCKNNRKGLSVASRRSSISDIKTISESETPTGGNPVFSGLEVTQFSLFSLFFLIN